MPDAAGLPKKIVVWASLDGVTRKETVEVPSDITTTEALEEWGCQLAAEMAEAGWYPADEEQKK